jgi:hypothetical protein
MAPSRELSFVLCGDLSSPLSSAFFSPRNVSHLVATSGFLLLSSPFAGGNRRRVSEAIWRERTKRRRKTRGVFVVGFTNASASIHGSLCVEQRWIEDSSSGSLSLLCTAHSTKLIGKRLGSFLGSVGERVYALSFTSDPPSPPNLSLFSCCCALDRGSCIRT